MNKRKTGKEYERLASDYLIRKGYIILEQNFSCRSGEIDLICLDKRELVFVEVKYRSMGRSGGSLEAVNVRKQIQISRTAIYYLMKTGRSMDCPCRFDVVGIDGVSISHIENAFNAMGVHL